MLKLSTALLYSEGSLSCDSCDFVNSYWILVLPSSDQACELLIRAEKMSVLANAFAWTLIRPPWPSDTSLKAKVFDQMLQYVTAIKVRRSNHKRDDV